MKEKFPGEISIIDKRTLEEKKETPAVEIILLEREMEDLKKELISSGGGKKEKGSKSEEIKGDLGQKRKDLNNRIKEIETKIKKLESGKVNEISAEEVPEPVLSEETKEEKPAEEPESELETGDEKIAEIEQFIEEIEDRSFESLAEDELREKAMEIRTYLGETELSKFENEELKKELIRYDNRIGKVLSKKIEQDVLKRTEELEKEDQSVIKPETAEINWEELENDMYNKLYEKLEKEYNKANNQDLYAKKLRGNLENFIAEEKKIDREDKEFLRSFGFDKEDEENKTRILESYRKVTSKILSEIEDTENTKEMDDKDKKYTADDFTKTKEDAVAVENEVEKIEGKWKELEDFLKRDIASLREHYDTSPVKKSVIASFKKYMKNFVANEVYRKSFFKNISNIEFTEENKERFLNLASKLYGDLLKELETESISEQTEQQGTAEEEIKKMNIEDLNAEIEKIEEILSEKEKAGYGNAFAAGIESADLVDLTIDVSEYKNYLKKLEEKRKKKEDKKETAGPEDVPELEEDDKEIKKWDIDKLNEEIDKVEKYLNSIKDKHESEEFLGYAGYLAKLGNVKRELEGGEPEGEPTEPEPAEPVKTEAGRSWNDLGKAAGEAEEAVKKMETGVYKKIEGVKENPDIPKHEKENAVFSSGIKVDKLDAVRITTEMAQLKAKEFKLKEDIEEIKLKLKEEGLNEVEESKLQKELKELKLERSEIVRATTRLAIEKRNNLESLKLSIEAAVADQNRKVSKWEKDAGEKKKGFISRFAGAVKRRFSGGVKTETPAQTPAESENKKSIFAKIKEVFSKEKGLNEEIKDAKFEDLEGIFDSIERQFPELNLGDPVIKNEILAKLKDLKDGNYEEVKEYSEESIKTIKDKPDSISGKEELISFLERVGNIAEEMEGNGDKKIVSKETKIIIAKDVNKELEKHIDLTKEEAGEFKNREIVIPESINKQLEKFANEDREVQGILFYKKEGSRCLAEGMFLTGSGNKRGGSVETDHFRKEIADRFLEGGEYDFISFHTHPKYLGDGWSEKFSDFADIPEIKRWNEEKKDLMHLMVAPKKRTVAGIGDPGLIIGEDHKDYEKTEKQINDALQNIEQEYLKVDEVLDTSKGEIENGDNIEDIIKGVAETAIKLDSKSSKEAHRITQFILTICEDFDGKTKEMKGKVIGIGEREFLTKNEKEYFDTLFNKLKELNEKTKDSEMTKEMKERMKKGLEKLKEEDRDKFKLIRSSYFINKDLLSEALREQLNIKVEEIKGIEKEKFIAVFEEIYDEVKGEKNEEKTGEVSEEDVEKEVDAFLEKDELNIENVKSLESLKSLLNSLEIEVKNIMEKKIPNELTYGLRIVEDKIENNHFTWYLEKGLEVDSKIIEENFSKDRNMAKDFEIDILKEYYLKLLDKVEELYNVEKGNLEKDEEKAGEVSEDMKGRIRGGLEELKKDDIHTFKFFIENFPLMDSYLNSENLCGEDILKDPTGGIVGEGLKNIKLEEIKNIPTKDFAAVVKEIYNEVKGRDKEKKVTRVDVFGSGSGREGKEQNIHETGIEQLLDNNKIERINNAKDWNQLIREIEDRKIEASAKLDNPIMAKIHEMLGIILDNFDLNERKLKKLNYGRLNEFQAGCPPEIDNNKNVNKFISAVQYKISALLAREIN